MTTGIAPGKPSLSDPHLLVVDDDERLRALLTRYLSGNGFRVSAAAQAADARSLMKSMAFDCLILDVMMPGESGLELAKSVRQGSQLLPILMLTARGDPADRIAAPAEIAEDQVLVRIGDRQQRFQVTIPLVALDQGIAQKHDAVTVAQLETRCLVTSSFAGREQAH